VTSGFAIVTYTGTGANATVGHGLGKVAKEVIVRNYAEANTDWLAYHSGLTSATYVIYPYLTNAETSAPTVWNSTAPTTSVFSVGTNVDSNGSTKTFVAYVHAEIPGYSKFGSYTGNASTDGPNPNLGFKARYFRPKRTDFTGYWYQFDTARNLYNVTNTVNEVNGNFAETTGTNYAVDITAGSIKLRASHPDVNASGGTYIFSAYVDVTGNYSLAR
jgi:hypothetical protein